MERRPRLSSSVRVRRHIVGDVVRVILHAPGDRVLAVGEREWRVLRAMDGTRDLAGVAAKAVVPLGEVEAFARSLGELGLVIEPSDGAASERPRDDAFPPDRPIRALPGYRFRCDGTGGCCRTFGTVAFTPLEAARARACRPDVLDGGHHPGSVFSPERGLDETLLAVAMKDGACAYLEADGRCGIHAAAGPEHKPFGCRAFPMRFVDVGEEIRVAPRPECACVFDPDGDAPLTSAARGGDLPPETFVPRLPARIRLGGEEIDAAAFVAWCDAQTLPPEGADVAADLATWCDAQADALRSRSDADPDLHRMLAAAERFDRQNADWRADGDWVRRATGWTVAALRSVAADGTPPTVDPASERLTVRAALFGCALADAVDVASGLRALALHLRVARAFGAGARADPAGRHPIALVEALARGHGLGGGPSAT